MNDLPLPQLKQNPIKPRSSRGRWRAAVLIGVHLLIIAHVLHWWFFGETLAPVEPSESLYALRDGLINVGVIFFALALLATALFGRFVCGWLCHFVAVQDLCSHLLGKLGIRPKPFRSRLLLLAPLGLALYLFVWQPLAPRLLDGAPLVPDQGVQLAFTTEDYWGTFPPLWIAIPFVIVCGVLTVYFLGAKGFCTYACPYGGFFAPLDKIAPYRIVVDKDKCTGSGHCTAVCTSNVRVHQEVADYGKVVDPGCMKCTDCISACPNGALSLKFTTPPLFTKTPAPQRAPRWLSPGEDIAATVAFLGAFMASFRAYGPDLFPLLFAAGIGACAAPLGVVLWNLPRKANMRFARLQLKRSGRFTPAGISVGLLGLLLIALTAHTGLVNYHRWRIDASFGVLDVPAQAFLSPNPPTLSEEQRVTLEAGLTHFERMRSITPVFNERAYGRAAVMQMALGRFDDSNETLAQLGARTKPDDLTSATRAELLLRLGRAEEAEAFTATLTDAHPEFWQTRDVRNRILVARGESDRALGEAGVAISAMPGVWQTRDARAQTWAQIARLKAQQRDRAGALEAITTATEIAPKLVSVGELRAVFLLQLANDPDAAVEAMRRLSDEVAPKDPGLRYRFAQLGVALRRPELVREQGQRFIELQNESDEARRLVAELYRAAGIKSDG
ncbi:MAG: hypothetical protein Tsb0013_06220 [Phycisphaerales bacterium]